MLNHSDPYRARSGGGNRSLSIPTPVFSNSLASDWCVGSDPLHWDVPFTVRLMSELKRLFRRKDLEGTSEPFVSREISATEVLRAAESEFPMLTAQPARKAA